MIYDLTKFLPNVPTPSRKKYLQIPILPGQMLKLWLISWAKLCASIAPGGLVPVYSVEDSSWILV